MCPGCPGVLPETGGEGDFSEGGAESGGRYEAGDKGYELIETGFSGGLAQVEGHDEQLGKVEEGSHGGQVPGRVVVRGSVLEDEGFGVVGLLDALAVAEVDGRKALEDADQFAIGAFVAGFEAGFVLALSELFERDLALLSESWGLVFSCSELSLVSERGSAGGDVFAGRVLVLAS